MKEGVWYWEVWCTPVIPAYRRLRQVHNEFKASVGYIGRPCFERRGRGGGRGRGRKRLWPYSNKTLFIEYT
jgi:hypothetical protein